MGNSNKGQDATYEIVSESHNWFLKKIRLKALSIVFFAHLSAHISKKIIVTKY